MQAFASSLSGFVEDSFHFSKVRIQGVLWWGVALLALMVQPPPARHERRDKVKTALVCLLRLKCGKGALFCHDSLVAINVLVVLIL